MHGDIFRMLAGYNVWANARVYGAAGALPAGDFGADRSLFFGSIMGTLNHILVADRIWLKRITGSGEAPDRLDVVLFEDFAPLWDARRAEDARIESMIAGLSEADHAGSFTFVRASDGKSYTQGLVPTLLHLFNHQTHHRGQIHAALTGLGRDAPSLDMVAFQRE